MATKPRNPITKIRVPKIGSKKPVKEPKIETELSTDPNKLFSFRILINQAEKERMENGIKNHYGQYKKTVAQRMILVLGIEQMEMNALPF